ncbi:hypothetical protein E1301_Tti003089 [Triplophysa tibetana]|uniref:Uncharacterized protein n=1 Tax=Triplophysa tibetana TaxID=1572043 RepID=A0A5A9PS09_9TELE|nr:hypothetical protein E1301_Tti003089 [Triplophysa tibetana]
MPIDSHVTPTEKQQRATLSTLGMRNKARKEAESDRSEKSRGTEMQSKGRRDIHTRKDKKSKHQSDNEDFLLPRCSLNQGGKRSTRHASDSVQNGNASEPFRSADLDGLEAGLRRLSPGSDRAELPLLFRCPVLPPFYVDTLLQNLFLDTIRAFL